MKRTKLHAHPWLGMGLTLLAFGAAAAVPQAQARTVTLDIKAQPIGSALNEFARQSGVQVLFYSDVSDGVSVPDLAGTFAPDVALTKLLLNTGLTFEYVNSRTVAIHRVVGNVSEGENTQGESEPLFMLLANVQIAEALDAEDQQIGATENARGSDNDKGKRQSDVLEEVIVTAQKREERLIDVPQSISVLSTDYLAKLGALQFRDYANTVPGLSFMTAGAGYTQISLRGVTVGRDIGPTIGIYVDEVPYGASTNFASGSLRTLDMGAFDLDRIEVLRGPQGTLYGASTMGGLIKYVTKRPDTTRFGGDAQTGISSTRGGISYQGAVAVNAPIVTDKAAVRASGFYSHDGGYVDNLALGREDANRANIYGGRADLLLAPTEKLSVRMTGFLQNISREGEGTADYAFTGLPLDGSLDQRRLVEEPYYQRFRLISGTIAYDLGWASLTSISSYQTIESENVSDYSRIYVPLLRSIGMSSIGEVGFRSRITTDKFVQEVRLSSDGDDALEWVIGGFYTDENSESQPGYILRDLAGQPMPDNLGGNLVPSQYEEYAAFGDLTWHLTSKFNVTGGVRYAQNRQAFEQIGSGLFGRSRPTSRSTDDVFTYLANARYHFSDRAIGYLRYATGYKPGGPNIVVNNPTTGLPIGPDMFEADRLKSYEVGFKGETANRQLGIDVAAYYIDWSNIQISVVRGGFGFVSNAPGGASILGAELTFTARPASGFMLTGAIAYQDAEMSEANSDLGAADGERLPNVPRLTAAMNADYELPVGSWQPTVGATVRYVGDRTASFDNATGFRQYDLPDYTTVDLRTSVTLDRINVQLYVRNLFDERGQLSAITAIGTARAAIVQPLTIGVTASKKF